MKRNTLIRRSFAAGLIGLSTFALAACGGKPSESDIHKKLTEALISNGMPEAQAKKISDCMAPKLVETVSEDGLNTMMDTTAADFKGQTVPDVSSEDEKAINDAGKSCAGELTGN